MVLFLKINYIYILTFKENVMKKNTFITFITILSIFIFNSVDGQVLWSENFESYTLGNVGTDVTGTVPGQGNWYTRRAYTSDDISNENFRIKHDARRGKYLILESTTIEDPGIFKRTAKHMYNNIGSVWSLKDTINNILKIEFDYNYYFYSTSSNSFYILLTNNSHGHSYHHAHGLYASHYNNGKMDEVYNVTQQHISQLPNLLASPNTWHKMIIYIDIDNNESYVEFPYKNYAIKSTTLIGKYPFDPLDLDRFDIVFTSEDNFYGNSFLKVDNIKISAVNKLPTLNIIDLDSSKFNIYPNPANDIVTITNSESISIKQVEFYDLTGKLIRTHSFNNQAEIQLNVENLANGVYMLHIETNKGTAVKKLVKK